ncbi:MAG: ACP S-malonyltransferase [Phycisphaerae bacterium]|nr:ACP S-malonyltransferase [Phycisphaerae bacterium]
MKTAFIFPGQGAQAVGMGKDLYEALAAARAVFDQAEVITGLPIKRLCFEGPEEELNRTDNAQPAIFTVSAALLACLDSLLEPEKAAAFRPAFMAGLSLGEYSALYAADCIDFSDALRLVQLRGAAMQKAATAVRSGMVAVMGLDEAKVNELCQAAAQGEPLVAANFNAPGQIVVSGTQAACERAAEMAKDFGASGATVLNVAGAFHSPIMAPAADELGRALDGVSFRAPGSGGSIPCGENDLYKAGAKLPFATAQTEIISNVEAAPYGCLCRAKPLLMTQLTGGVRWQQSMEFLIAQGVETFYEIGPGRVLAGLMRRIHRKAEVVTINSRESLEKRIESNKS